MNADCITLHEGTELWRTWYGLYDKPQFIIITPDGMSHFVANSEATMDEIATLRKPFLNAKTRHNS